MEQPETPLVKRLYDELDADDYDQGELETLKKQAEINRKAIACLMSLCVRNRVGTVEEMEDIAKCADWSWSWPEAEGIK
jgi:hypothetical protein